MLIDAHCHLWRIGKYGHQWPTRDLERIYRDFDLDDLREASASQKLGGAVLVQSQASTLDTEWLLNLAASDPLVLGVVGWTDLTARDAPAQVRTLARNPWLKGLRPMLQDLANDWILAPALEPAVDAMISEGLAFDALVRPRHLGSLLELTRRWPKLRVVIDHGAKPDIANGGLEPWLTDMAALGEQPGVHCKLSGLLTEAGAAPTREMVAPYVSRLAKIFGPHRLMWGSDWPVLNLVGEYPTWRAMCASWFEDDQHAALFSGTARKFYRL